MSNTFYQWGKIQKSVCTAQHFPWINNCPTLSTITFMPNTVHPTLSVQNNSVQNFTSWSKIPIVQQNMSNTLYPFGFFCVIQNGILMIIKFGKVNMVLQKGYKVLDIFCWTRGILLQLVKFWTLLFWTDSAQRVPYLVKSCHWSSSCFYGD